MFRICSCKPLWLLQGLLTVYVSFDMVIRLYSHRSCVYYFFQDVMLLHFLKWIYLFERQSSKRRGREIFFFPTTSSPPKWPQQLELALAEARSLELPALGPSSLHPPADGRGQTWCEAVPHGMPALQAVALPAIPNPACFLDSYLLLNYSHSCDLRKCFSSVVRILVAQRGNITKSN